MISLNSQDENQLSSFSKLIDDHLKYYEECISQFKNLKELVATMEIAPLKPIARIPTISARSSVASVSKLGERQNSRSNIGKSQDIPRVGSTRSIVSHVAQEETAEVESKNQVEAMFEFKAENANELSSKII